MFKKTTLLFFILLFFAPQFAFSVGSSFLEVSPAVAEMVLTKPEETKTLEITFSNKSEEFLDLQLSISDFREKDLTAQVEFLPNSSSYEYSLVSFLSLSHNYLVLEPNGKQKIKVTVKNRDDLSPGGHYAAVIAKIAGEKNKKQEGTIISPSVSALILLRKVGGEKFNLSLKEVDWPKALFVSHYPQKVNLLFQNEGNIHIIPYGVAEIKDVLGRTIYKGVINFSSAYVFPSSRRFIEIEMGKTGFSWPVSVNRLEVRGHDSLNVASFSYRDSFIYIQPLVAFVITLTILGLIIKKVKRAKQLKDKK